MFFVIDVFVMIIAFFLYFYTLPPAIFASLFIFFLNYMLSLQLNKWHEVN